MTDNEWEQYIFDNCISRDREVSMSRRALESDIKMGVPLFKTAEIFSDSDFNCRGLISPHDVIDLARSVQDIGLQQAVMILPRREDTPPQYKYVLIAGHRRHKAYVVNNWNLIPAILRDNMDIFKARSYNLKENLERKQLNILQEAKAIQPFSAAGWTRAEIAAEIGQSMGWVQVREHILSFPEEIQIEAASGLLTQAQIKDLVQIRDPLKQIEAVKKIKEHRQKGEGKKPSQIIKEVVNFNQRKKRTPEEIVEFIEIIVNALKDPVKNITGYGFHTRCLAWSCGNLSDQEIHEDLAKEAQAIGHKYDVPKFIDQSRKKYRNASS